MIPAAVADGISAEFSGWDVLTYWWYTVKTFMSQYSWQVRTAYTIIVLCTAALVVLMFLFRRQIKRRDDYQKVYQQCANTYYDSFFEILESKWEYGPQEILDACDADEEDFDYYDGIVFADLICRIRMELKDIPYLPNLQVLAELTGAKKAIETRLSKREDVNTCLQYVCTMPLVISEGLLALYTGNKSGRTRELALLANLIVSSTEPFAYLLKDMNRDKSRLYRITVHRILAWRDAQDMMVAPLMMLAQTSTNTEMASFLISEVSYWSPEEEQHRLIEFLTDKRIPCRIAAIEAMQRLLLPDIEDKLYESYESQPQDVRRVIVRALMSYHSGKYTDFFANVFYTAPSHTSRMNVLECLYSYTSDSRDRFEKMYLSSEEKDRKMFDQVRAAANLSAMNYSRS